jgi:adenosine kinase
MPALICGSLAYDNIMVFPGRFRDHILPDKIHMLSVSFLVPTMRRNFGGCAGNVAYSLKLLGGEGAPMGVVGHDFGAYREWMERHGIDQTYIKVVEQEFTAQCFITTDLDDNQITAFHPGAMGQSHIQAVPTNAGFTLGFISPDGREGMIQHAQQFADAGIPFIFDPGQGLPMFNGEELMRFVDQATWVIVNDYESQLLCERTQRSCEELARKVDALIVTRGGEGSRVYTRDRTIDIPAVKARVVSDPTGCGDAYRAGIAYGLMKGMDWETTARIGSLIGAIKVETHGPQGHSFTPDEFADRFNEAFGYRL